MSVRTPKLRERIVTVLAASVYALSCRTLAVAIYADDPDGGPLHAESAIRGTIHQMRRSGDHRVATVAGGYALAGRANQKRPPDPRIVIVKHLRAHGYRFREIGEELGISESYACILHSGGRERRRAAA